LYRCIAGVRPMSARERLVETAAGMPDPLVPAARAGLGRYPAALLAATDAALRLSPRERPQSIAALRALLGPAAGLQPWRPLIPGLSSSVASLRPIVRQRKALAVAAVIATVAVFALYHATTPTTQDQLGNELAAASNDSDLARRPGRIFRD